MPAEYISLVLTLGGRHIIKQFTSLSIDEATIQDIQLTSNQSGLAVNFGGVATAYTLYLDADQAMEFNINSGTTYILSANGFILLHRTSGAALTLTNTATTSVATCRVAILGT